MPFANMEMSNKALSLNLRNRNKKLNWRDAIKKQSKRSFCGTKTFFSVRLQPQFWQIIVSADNFHYHHQQLSIVSSFHRRLTTKSRESLIFYFKRGERRQKTEQRLSKQVDKCSNHRRFMLLGAALVNSMDEFVRTLNLEFRERFNWLSSPRSESRFFLSLLEKKAVESEKVNIIVRESIFQFLYPEKK